MQPLSYQILPYTCWVTSMLNGLLLLYADKNRIPGLVYRLLHSLLSDDGVQTHGKRRKDLSTVLDAIQLRTGLRVVSFHGEEVEATIRQLHFCKQVAICHVDAGSHAILLSGRAVQGGWIEAFDPDWDGVKKRREVPGAYIAGPQEEGLRQRGRVNLLIAEDYLLHTRRRRSGGHEIGPVATRTLIVMEKRE